MLSVYFLTRFSRSALVPAVHILPWHSALFHGHPEIAPVRCCSAAGVSPAPFVPDLTVDIRGRQKVLKLYNGQNWPEWINQEKSKKSVSAHTHQHFKMENEARNKYWCSYLFFQCIGQLLWKGSFSNRYIWAASDRYLLFLSEGCCFYLMPPLLNFHMDIRVSAGRALTVDLLCVSGMVYIHSHLFLWQLYGGALMGGSTTVIAWTAPAVGAVWLRCIYSCMTSSSCCGNLISMACGSNRGWRLMRGGARDGRGVSRRGGGRRRWDNDWSVCPL